MSDDPRFCGARKKNGGGTCTRPSGWSTNHPGVGRCKWHAGNTRNHQTAAAKQIATVMGAPLDIEPHDALIWCVRVAAGEVGYCSSRIAELDEASALMPSQSIVDRPLKEESGAESATLRSTETRTDNMAQLHVWIRARQDATDRLARYSKMALDAGVAERAIRLAEGYGEVLARMLTGVFADLVLTEEQQARAPDIVRKHLVLLEGGKPEVIEGEVVDAPDRAGAPAA